MEEQKEEQKKLDNKNKFVVIGSVVLLIVIFVGAFFISRINKEKRIEEAKRQEEIRKEEERKMAEEERLIKKKEENEELAKFYMSDNRVLDLKVPDGFSAEKVEDTIVLLSNDKSFGYIFSLTPFQSSFKSSERSIEEDLENTFEKKLKYKVEEDDVIIKQLESNIINDGHYFMPITYSGSTNKGGEYKYTAQAEGYIDNNFLASTYVGRSNAENDINQWLNVIYNVEIKKNESFNYLESADKKIGMKINSDNFVLQNKVENYLIGYDGDLVISLTVDDKHKTEEECYQFVRDNVKSFSELISDKKEDSSNGYLALEYILKEHESVKIDQKNSLQVSFIGGNCVAKHISKVLFTEADQKTFDKYFEKIEIIKK